MSYNEGEKNILLLPVGERNADICFTLMVFHERVTRTDGRELEGHTRAFEEKLTIVMHGDGCQIYTLPNEALPSLRNEPSPE